MTASDDSKLVSADDLFRAELVRRNLPFEITDEGLYEVQIGDVTATVNLENVRRNYERDNDAIAIARFAKQLATNRVNLMFDCEATGVDGAKEALWFFAELQLDVRLGWSPAIYFGVYAGRQPKGISRAELVAVLLDRTFRMI